MNAVEGEEGGGARRRTSLAAERTLLAWWRTGLTAIAVAIGVGRLLPELSPNATQWPYVVLGVGFALYGMALFVFGTRRMGVLDRELARSAENRALLLFMGGGVVLGIGALAVIVGE